MQAHLQEGQEAADVGIDLQVCNDHVAHTVGALPLVAALHHAEKGVQVEARQPRDASEPAPTTTATLSPTTHACR